MELYLPLIPIVILAIALIWLFFQNKELKQKLEQIEKGPDYWNLVKQEFAKTSEGTQKILSQTQETASQIIKDEQTEVSSFEKNYEQRLERLTNEFYLSLEKTLTTINKQLSDSVRVAHEQNNKFIIEQQQQSLQWQQDAEVEMKKKIVTFLEAFEQNMSQFLINAQGQSLESINLEIKSARSLIDSYKAQQLSIIEENIVAVLERTLSIVLKQKLTLEDQMDLVYEALEKAKLEKFLI